MKLDNPKWLLWNETKELIQAFEGAEFRFVGGCVRDSLLGLEVKDVDVAIALQPEQVTQLLAKFMIKTIPTGFAYGTVTTVIGKRSFEITSLRKDIQTDGRRAVVSYTNDFREDAMRRDFTMNALYADYNGEITDYFDGISDALAGRVRFIGDANERITEDALRILRFFRFFAGYGKGEVDAAAIEACAKNAAKIENLSGERIQQEMFKLLLAKKAALVIGLMQTNNILQYIIPKEISVSGLQNYSGGNSITALASLLRTINAPKSIIEKIAERWKLSKNNYRKLLILCERKIAPADLANEKLLKKHIRNLGKEIFIEQIMLLQAEGVEQGLCEQAIALANTWQVPEFPITGDDLLARGVAQSKAMGDTLKKLEGRWEGSDYSLSKEELLTNNKHNYGGKI